MKSGPESAFRRAGGPQLRNLGAWARVTSKVIGVTGGDQAGSPGAHSENDNSPARLISASLHFVKWNLLTASLLVLDICLRPLLEGSNLLGSAQTRGFLQRLRNRLLPLQSQQLLTVRSQMSERGGF